MDNDQNKTSFEQLEEKITPIKYVTDIHTKKPFDLQKALKAAQELRKMKSVFVDENSLRAESTLQV